MSKLRFKLSQEQEAAIDINKNIAVSAGAGSGKTRVLTSRFLKLLESGFEIEEIAAITFTEKAALEMKQRIREALIIEISNSDSQGKLKWMRHLDKLSRANISTIHGFCSNIIKENAAYLRLDFNYKIISEVDKTLLLREAWESAKAKLFAQPEYEVIVEKLTDIYGSDYVGSGIFKDILAIRSKILDQGKLIEDLYNNAQPYSVEKFIFHMVKEIEEYYSTSKLSKDLLDYSDLEGMTLTVLENDRLRERYRKRYKTLLVDEFQDTNEVQRKIIYHIAADDNGVLVPARLFIVGDFKQSIYGFRGTDYRIFKNVSGDIGDDGKVALSTCYRSKGEIIEGVNSIFSKLIEDYEPLKYPGNMTEKENRIKLITYEEDKASSDKLMINVKNLLQGKASTFNSINEAFSKLKTSYSEITQKENKGGIAVARAIKHLRDKGLEFKDICILVRSRYTISEIEEELKRKNVPYCIIGGSGFYEKSEVDDILNLYRVVIRGVDGEFSYEDNVNFIKALRGPLFEIPDNLILNIRIQRDECKCDNLYDAISYVIDGMSESENKARLRFVYNTLEYLSSLKQRLSVVHILKAIIKECRVYETMLCQADGIQKFRNIEKLLYIAKKFDAEEIFTLQQFVEYIELLSENGSDDSEAALDTEDSEAVKIMTIHQSKGLEFKGVIVPKIDSDLLSISKKSKNNIVYNKDKVILSRDLETSEDNEAYIKYYNAKFAKEIDEYIRLLYVALTRAEDYAILTGKDDGKTPVEFSNDAEKANNLNSFLKLIKYAINVKNADSSLLDFIKYEDLGDLGAVDSVSNIEEIEQGTVDQRLKYICDVKPNVKVSASSYMKYKKCPRKYYIENVLRVSGSDYIDIEFSEEVTTKPNTLSGSQLGTIVHSIIESINKEADIDEEVAIGLAIETFDLKHLSEVNKTLKRYVDNYMLLEEGKASLGKRVHLVNELEYNLTPYDDGKLSIMGFIDRLEIFEDDGRYTAVVTDYKTNRLRNGNSIKELTEAYEPQLQLYGKAAKELLYVNGIKVDDIKLQLYFLDKAEKVEITYEEEKVEDQLKAMENIFLRNLSTCSVSEFPKGNGSCSGCDYREICIV